MVTRRLFLGFGDEANLGCPMLEMLKDPFPVELELLDVSSVASKSSKRMPKFETTPAHVSLF